MYNLRARLGVSSVRTQCRLADPTKRLQAILDLKRNDIQGRWGIAQVRQRLANAGISITR